MAGHRVGLPLVMVASAAAAGAATVALRPRRGLIAAAPVNATAYFSASELDRARAYARPRRLLALADLAVTGGALAAAALRRPPAAAAALDRAAERPLAGAAAAGAALSLGLTAITLPLGVASERHARRFGLSTQRWGGWTADLLKSSAIGSAFSGAGATALVALARRFPGRWWLPGSTGALAVGTLFAFAAPVLLDPIFNRYTPLPDGPLRSEILELAARAGVHVGEVYHVDASRRTTAANAYVGGLGRTKRVVLFDTLLESFAPEEVRSVVAHELAHVKHRDVIRTLAWLAVAAPAATLAVERLSERVEPHADGPALIPAVALASAAVSSWMGVAGSALSRRVEARADAFALRLTRDADAFIAVERRLTTQNLADPQPPAWLHALLATHPTATERIGYAIAWSADGERSERGRDAG
jgi:STE24 endopeptidase